MRGSLVVALLIWGCSLAPSGPRGVQGVPIDPGPPPGSEECANLVRADLVTAGRIRADLRVDGISSDDAAVRAAAADPQADLDVLGIPLRAGEVQALAKSGLAMDDYAALAHLVNVGATERFGGIWIDPPGSDRYVVSVVGGDPAALARARCVEGPRTSYVTARISQAQGLALQNRITQDWQALAAQGIRLSSTGYDVIKGVVVVGVTGLTEEIRRQLVGRYGDIEVEEQGAVVPL